VVDDASIEFVEDLALTADVVDLVSQVVVDRKCLVELLHHLLLQLNSLQHTLQRTVTSVTEITSINKQPVLKGVKVQK